VNRVIGILIACAAVACGFGGPEFVWLYPNVDGLNRRLSEIGLGFGSEQVPQQERPFYALGGHGAGQVGAVTVGGRGAAGGVRANGDIVVSDLAFATGALEVGYPWSPVEFCWLRPTVELQASGWVDLVHASNTVWGEPELRRWFVGWEVSAVPGLEAMVRLRYLETRYVGLYGSAGYAIPLVPAQYYGHSNPPEFDFSGFVLRAGLRLGLMDERVFRF
jgi:hypothetical protein